MQRLAETNGKATTGTGTEIIQRQPEQSAIAQSFSFSDMQAMAKAVANSGLFGIRTADAALTLMMLSQSEGLHPVMAVRQFHIIEGKPSLRADAMQARFQQAGGRIAWKTRTDSVCEAVFTHPDSPEPLTVRWDSERAKRAQLVGKTTWQKHPQQMLAARVISEGIRAVLPSCVFGFYTPEEVQAFDGPTAAATEPERKEPSEAERIIEFLAVWDEVMDGHGIEAKAGRGLLHAALKKRGLTLETATTDQLHGIIEDARNMTPEQAAKFRPAEKTPAPQAPAKEAEPADDDALGEWWGRITDSIADAGGDIAAACTAIQAYARKLHPADTSPTPEKSLTSDERNGVLASILAGKFDFAA